MTVTYRKSMNRRVGIVFRFWALHHDFEQVGTDRDGDPIWQPNAGCWWPSESFITLALHTFSIEDLERCIMAGPPGLADGRGVAGFYARVVGMLP